MLGIIKDGVFKPSNRKKILIYTDNQGKKVSIINPKDEHFRAAGYKEVIFINEKPMVNDNQYTNVVYLDKGDYIEAIYEVKEYEESEEF